MNGFADQGLDEGAFGEKKGISEGLRTFDAFRELDIGLPSFNSIVATLDFALSSPLPAFDCGLKRTSENQTHLLPPQLQRGLHHHLPPLCILPPLLH